MIKFRLKLFAATLLSLPLLISAAPVKAEFDPFCPSASSCSCSGQAANSPVCKDRAKKNSNPISGSEGILNKTVNILAFLAGLAAVIQIIIAGFNLVTSSGNSETAAKARSRISGALIGLVIVILAWLIVSFAINTIF